MFGTVSYLPAFALRTRRPRAVLSMLAIFALGSRPWRLMRQNRQLRIQPILDDPRLKATCRGPCR